MLSEEVRKRTARDAVANAGRYISDLPEKKVWSGPHMMASINTPVVHATAVGEGFDFSYHERMLNGGKDAWEKATESWMSGYLLPSVTRPLMMVAAAPVAYLYFK